MAGTKAGGLKAAATNRARHGSDFYKIIAAKGGRASRRGGFAANPILASLAGAKGGRLSKRGPAKYDIMKPEGSGVSTPKSTSPDTTSGSDGISHAKA